MNIGLTLAWLALICLSAAVVVTEDALKLWRGNVNLPEGPSAVRALVTAQIAITGLAIFVGFLDPLPALPRAIPILISAFVVPIFGEILPKLSLLARHKHHKSPPKYAQIAAHFLAWRVWTVYRVVIWLARRWHAHPWKPLETDEITSLLEEALGIDDLYLAADAIQRESDHPLAGLAGQVIQTVDKHDPGIRTRLGLASENQDNRVLALRSDDTVSEALERAAASPLGVFAVSVPRPAPGDAWLTGGRTPTYQTPLYRTTHRRLLEAARLNPDAPLSEAATDRNGSELLVPLPAVNNRDEMSAVLDVMLQDHAANPEFDGLLRVTAGGRSTPNSYLTLSHTAERMLALWQPRVHDAPSKSAQPPIAEVEPREDFSELADRNPAAD